MIKLFGQNAIDVLRGEPESDHQAQQLGNGGGSAVSGPAPRRDLVDAHKAASGGLTEAKGLEGSAELVSGHWFQGLVLNVPLRAGREQVTALGVAGRYNAGVGGLGPHLPVSEPLGELGLTERVAPLILGHRLGREVVAPADVGAELVEGHSRLLGKATIKGLDGSGGAAGVGGLALGGGHLDAFAGTPEANPILDRPELLDVPEAAALGAIDRHLSLRYRASCSDVTNVAYRYGKSSTPVGCFHHKMLQVAPLSKRKPMRPQTVHDRTAERPTPGEFAPAVVDDPFEPGAQIAVLRRLDVLSRMYSRGQLSSRRDDNPKGDGSEAIFKAGRKYQELHEHAAIGTVGSVDTTKEAVDGGRLRDPLTDKQQKALREIARVEASLKREWGLSGVSLVRSVLTDGRNLTQVAAIMGHSTNPQGPAMRSLSWLFVQCLEQVAVDLGYLDS